MHYQTPIEYVAVNRLSKIFFWRNAYSYLFPYHVVSVECGPRRFGIWAFLRIEFAFEYAIPPVSVSGQPHCISYSNWECSYSKSISSSVLALDMKRTSGKVSTGALLGCGCLVCTTSATDCFFGTKFWATIRTLLWQDHDTLLIPLVTEQSCVE